MVEHFLKHTVRERLLLLLFDGHSTHYQPDVVQFVKDNDALMLCLPPNTTNEASPLQGHSQEIFFTEAKYEHELIKKTKACHTEAAASVVSMVTMPLYWIPWFSLHSNHNGEKCIMSISKVIQVELSPNSILQAFFSKVGCKLLLLLTLFLVFELVAFFL